MWSSSSDSGTVSRSLSSAPLSVSVDELRSELSLLGFTSVPQQRLFQFKQDLEYVLRSRAALEASPADAAGPGAERRGTAAPGWDTLPAWPSSPHQAPGLDPCTKHTVGAQALDMARVPVVTRKVLRRNSAGQVQVCDESLRSADTEDSRMSCAEPHAVTSFIRLPPYSLLEQYRQRSDPVGRYQEYKRSWDALQVSLEKSKKELRWGVRERMMSAPPLPLPRALPTPNSYVIPTEKKRYGLRWAVRQDLVHGNLPRGGYS